MTMWSKWWPKCDPNVTQMWPNWWLCDSNKLPLQYTELEEGAVTFHVPKEDSDGYINNKKDLYKFKFEDVFPEITQQDTIFEKVWKDGRTYFLKWRVSIWVLVLRFQTLLFITILYKSSILDYYSSFMLCILEDLSLHFPRCAWTLQKVQSKATTRRYSRMVRPDPVRPLR